MSEQQIDSMNSVFHYFFIVDIPNTKVQLFNDHSEYLYEKHLERDFING